MVILAKMASIDSGFTYNFCVDKSYKIIDFVWMTSVVISKLYRFRSFISADFIKRKTNVHLWPYIGPVVMNTLKKTCVVCKSFMLRSSAYYFVLKSIFLMAPNFPKNNFKLIYSNGFFLKTS